MCANAFARDLHPNTTQSQISAHIDMHFDMWKENDLLLHQYSMFPVFSAATDFSILKSIFPFVSTFPAYSITEYGVKYAAVVVVVVVYFENIWNSNRFWILMDLLFTTVALCIGDCRVQKPNLILNSRRMQKKDFFLKNAHQQRNNHLFRSIPI